MSLAVRERFELGPCRIHSAAIPRTGFVLRTKKSLQFRRRYSRPVDRTRGVFCDQAGVLSVPRSAEGYPEPLRRVRFHDLEDGKQITLLSNHFHLPALTIAELYRCRWQVELLFEWIKQDLRIKAFYGTSENAVKTQSWIAICVYVLVTILKKRLGTEMSLYTMLQILSVTLFEKIAISQVLTRTSYTPESGDIRNQLLLFNF